jgi:uncharacterized protein YqgV (UPF0045/DUF77 family)
MTTRTYTTKSGTTFEWEETNEVLEAIKQLHSNDRVPSTGSENPVV